MDYSIDIDDLLKSSPKKENNNNNNNVNNNKNAFVNNNKKVEPKVQNNSNNNNNFQNKNQNNQNNTQNRKNSQNQLVNNKNKAPELNSSQFKNKEVKDVAKTSKVAKNPIKTSNEQERSSEAPKKVEITKLGETTSVKGVDKGLLAKLRALFPYSNNNQDALNAFLAIYMESSTVGLSEDVKKLIKDFRKSDDNLSVKDNMNDLKERMKQMEMLLEEISLSTLYTNYDRLGFRKTTVMKLSDVNFIDNDILKLSENLKKQTKSFVDYRTRSEGRPFK